MDAYEIIKYISESEKKTPVKAYVREKSPIDYGNSKVFGAGDKVVFGDWRELGPILEQNRDQIEDLVVENNCRNSAIPMLDLKNINARIEPGAIIREKVEIGDGAVIMMGAILNIGAVVGEKTMIDMGAVLGGRAIIAGVVEPPSATPCVVEDDVVIGANAVILEGVRVGKGAVIAAGAVVISDVPQNAVMAGIPAQIIKMKDEKTSGKTQLIDALRNL